MSLISGSSNKDCKRPRPSTCAIAALVSCCSCKSDSGTRPSWRRDVPNRAHSACAALLAKSHSWAMSRSASPLARRKMRSSASASPTRVASAATNRVSGRALLISLCSCKTVMVAHPLQHRQAMQYAPCLHLQLPKQDQLVHAR